MAIEFSDELLARRGEVFISHALFDARMHKIPADQRSKVVSDPERIGSLISELLVTQAIFRDAMNNRILQAPEVQSRLYFAIGQQLITETRDHIMAQNELADYTAQAREIYLSDPTKYKTEPKVSFTQVLIEDLDKGEEKAKELLNLYEAGTEFSSLVAQYSDDPSAQENGGEYHAISHKRLDTALTDALKTMKPGEATIVESRFGWHIIRLDEHFDARVKDFEEVADQLKLVARARHLDTVWQNYLSEHAKGELQIAPGAVEQILERYPPN